MQGVGDARTQKPQAVRRPPDKALMTIMALLVMAGLTTLFSATYYAASAQDPLSEMKKQFLGLALGLCGMWATMRIPYGFWSRRRVVLSLTGGSVLLLVAVLIPGVGRNINGSRRWLGVGSLSFQPSELAKYAAVLFLALALSGRQKKMGSLIKGIVPLLILPGVMFLLILEQPNLSTAGTIVIVSVLMILLAAGIVGVVSVQAFINMGVVVGILPTTGLPLPFFSAGGTSLSITLTAMGVVLNVSRYATSTLA